MLSQMDTDALGQPKILRALSVSQRPVLIGEPTLSGITPTQWLICCHEIARYRALDICINQCFSIVLVNV